MHKIEAAFFNRFTIEMTKEQAKDTYHTGRCDEDAKALLKNPAIRKQLDLINDDDLINELRDGGYSPEELTDREINEMRIVWIAAGNINFKFWQPTSQQAVLSPDGD